MSLHKGIHRYFYDAPPGGCGDMHLDDDVGQFVLFSDHQSSLAEREQRIAELRKRLGELKDDARELPQELFDGLTVYKSLPRKAMGRTSAENVSDVLDAVVKLIRDRKARAALATEGEKR